MNDKRREYHKKYYKKNRERILKRCKEYTKINKEKIREMLKENIELKEKIKEYGG